LREKSKREFTRKKINHQSAFKKKKKSILHTVFKTSGRNFEEVEEDHFKTSSFWLVGKNKRNQSII